MADLEHDYAAWAKRKADPADDGDMGMPVEQGGDEGDAEAPAPAPELIRHAAMEITEAVEFLNQAKGQVEDQAAIDDKIASLTATVEELNEEADELEGGEEDESDEDEGDEDMDDEDGTPAPDMTPGM